MAKMQQEKQHGLEEYDEKVNEMKEQMVMQDNNHNNNESFKQHGIKKGLELQLCEKDVLLKNLKKEVENLKSFEANAMAMFSEYKRKVQELEVEVNKRKESEANLVEELNMLKNDLKSATLAEENSKIAMDDLAFALKEVAIESNEVKEKLALTRVELEHTKGDAERWRTMLGNIDEKYKELLDASKKEAERFENIAERLRLEAEESNLVWSGKEAEFVSCIRQGEEERVNTRKEIGRVFEMVREAENRVKVSKDENQKLRDILKQALNEANVAKGGAEIAKAENARLHDSITLLVQENEILKIHEASSFQSIKELKRLLSESSMKKFIQ